MPDDEMTADAGVAAASLAKYMRAHPTPTRRVELRVADSPDTSVTVPTEAFRLFIGILDELARGNAVTVAPVSKELTTQQAAEMLNVSRPYLVKLLTEKEIPYRKVGNRRRVRLVDLLKYQREDDSNRREIVRDLTREAEELGLYD